MGDPKRLRKKYSSPKRPWDRQRVVSERQILEKYGLSTKRELRVAEETIRKKGYSAKLLLAATKEKSAEGFGKLISSLNRMGLVSQDATLMDILSLTPLDLLERRLQTIVYRQGLANTMKQARQFILHGIIAVNGQRVRSPSYIVRREEEDKITYFGNKKPKVLDFISATPELRKQKGVAEKDSVEKSVEENIEEKVEEKPAEKGVTEEVAVEKAVAEKVAIEANDNRG